MADQSRTYLTAADLDRISQAVTEAEQRTSGEIVPMIVGQSDDYPGARWRLAIVTALLFGLVTALWLTARPGVGHLTWILWAEIPGLYIGYWLGGFSPILRPFLAAAKIDEEVHQRALQAFFSRELHATRDRTGILIMVSLLEHRLEILADSGINARVPADTWQQIIFDMLAQIKAGDLAEGFCTAIHECAEVLAREFPGSHDNPDEISNRVIIEE
ncbi:MAG: TPM domain-containing protein [Gammaproteobacteria bacterium]